METGMYYLDSGAYFEVELAGDGEAFGRFHYSDGDTLAASMNEIELKRRIVKKWPKGVPLWSHNHAEGGLA